MEIPRKIYASTFFSDTRLDGESLHFTTASSAMSLISLTSKEIHNSLALVHRRVRLGTGRSSLSQDFGQPSASCDRHIPGSFITAQSLPEKSKQASMHEFERLSVSTYYVRDAMTEVTGRPGL